jgi:hypothetical protein
LEIEGPHQHHHGHGTGMRWLDISLALSAFLVSIVSLYLGIHSAHTMEKLVASNSYPHIEMAAANKDTKADKEVIWYTLSNTGLGPARLEWINVSVKGQPVHNLFELLEACCKKYDKVLKVSGFTMFSEIGKLIPKGEEIEVFRWPQPEQPNGAWQHWHDNLDDVTLEACYCSIFDECYIRKHGAVRPIHVEACTVPPTAFVFSFTKSDTAKFDTFNIKAIK